MYDPNIVKLTGEQFMKTQIIDIGERVRCILDSIPPDVILVAAAKTRTITEVEAAIQAGVTHFGYDYV